ncbi:unnamed protein product, partial [Sphacelaria rigidula]
GPWLGGAYSFVACLGRLTIDHASLSRRSAVLLLIETSPTFRCSLRFFHTLRENLLHILAPSWFAVSGHHLSPRSMVGENCLACSVASARDVQQLLTNQALLHAACLAGHGMFS